MHPPAPRNRPYRSHHKRARNAVRTATIVLVLLTAVLVGHVGAARPAHAAGSHQLCLPIVESGHIVEFVCHDIWYRNPRVCRWCSFPLVFEVGCDPARSIAVQREYLGRLGGGLAELGQAATATDAALTRRLRAAAMGDFLAAAQELRQSAART
jgi:hypothetical protein